MVDRIIHYYVFYHFNANFFNQLFPGNMKTQLVGPLSFRGMNMKAEELEYMLGKVSRTDFGITVIVNVTEYITVF